MDEGALKCGDLVTLLSESILVATGRVVNVDPHATCHGVSIKDGRFSVLVELSYFDGMPLPYSHSGADTIGEAIGSIVLWDLLSATLVLGSFGSSTLVADSSFPSQDLTPDSHEAPTLRSDSQPPESRKDVFSRQCWFKERVLLFSQDAATILARGIITNPHPMSFVNNQRVGTDNIGVNVLEILVHNEETKVKIPSFIDGTTCLVLWPISLAKIVGFSGFLRDLLPPKREDLPVEASLR
ncbi:unnamed protein product [Calypogeia fissa]